MLRKLTPLLLLTGLLFLIGGALVVFRVIDGGLNWTFLGNEADVSKGREKEVVVKDGAADSLRRKLNELVIDSLSLSESTLEEAIEFLRIRSYELENEPEPVNRGISFVVRNPTDTWKSDVLDPIDAGDGLGGDDLRESVQTITLEARKISVADALDLICEKANMKWRIGEFAIEIQPKEMKWPGQKVPDVAPENDPFAE